MKPSAAQGTLLVCIFLVIPMTVADVSFTFFYQCNSPPCKFIIWFSEYWLKSFRDCLCSASTSACYVYYSYYQGYFQVYNQANQTYSLKINNNSYKYQAEFNCTMSFNISNFQGDVQCYRSSTASENALKSLQFTTDTNTCDFRCVNIKPSYIYNINFDNNEIIKHSTATCRPHFTNTTTTTETLTTQQQTMRAESSIAKSTATTAQLSAVANLTRFPDYNHSQTNTSGVGDTRNMHDNTIDTCLITGVITAIVAVIVIVIVIAFLWRIRINKSNHERSKDENTLTERPITVSDPKLVILHGRNNQHFLENSKEKKELSAETDGTYETITSEYVVAYNTVKTTSERQSETVSTSLIHDIDTFPTQIKINSLTSADSTKVDFDPQYCNVNNDTTQKPKTPIKPNFNILFQTKSEGTYINIHQSTENHDKTNFLKNTHPITFDPPTNKNFALSDDQASVAICPAQMTAGVYAKIGDQNRDRKNPYNALG